MKVALINMMILVGLDLFLIVFVSIITIAIMENKKLKDMRAKWHNCVNNLWTDFCNLTKTIREDIKHNWIGIVLLAAIIICVVLVIFKIENKNLSSLSISVMGTFIGVIIIFVFLRPRLYIEKELTTLTIDNKEHLKVRIRNLGIFPVTKVEVQLLFYREIIDKNGNKIKGTRKIELLRPDTQILRGLFPIKTDPTYGCGTELDLEELKEQRTHNKYYEGIICRVIATHAISGVTYVRERIFEKDEVDKFLTNSTNSGKKDNPTMVACDNIISDIEEMNDQMKDIKQNVKVIQKAN